MPFFESKDHTRLFYRDYGAGDTVLFVSSWGLSSRMWDYQTTCMVDHGLRCITYDRRSHGRSDDPGRGYDYDTLAGDLAALIDYLDLEHVTLVGHSMGGGEVVRYLTRYGPQRIKGAVLVCAGLPFLLKTEDNPDGVDAEALNIQRETLKADFTKWMIENEPPYLNTEGPTPLGEWTRWDMLQASLPALIALNRSIFETDFREEMRAITIPTLIIHGDNDYSFPIQISGRKSAQLLPNNRFIIYENGPHGLYLTHVDRLNTDLLSFVKG
ncbi:alpha/beta hydrolase [Alicyclobacillus curvatus]|nr:alpha/beta hydrolase [Alicyclobacillus curvatus]